MVALRNDINVQLAPNFKFVSEATEKQQLPQATFKEDFDFKKIMKIESDAMGRGTVGEFLGTGSIGKKFFERQLYEVEAGRKEVPILYEGIYDIVVDANFPKTMEINTLGPAGVVFELIPEGGGVKFATVGEGNKSLTMQHYGVGLSYSEDMFIYNQTWMFPGLERDFGNAYNALLNHIHLGAIINSAPAGTTDGAAINPMTYRVDEPIELKYLRTMEAAITDSINDEDNPRYGPYILLASTTDAMIAMRALRTVPQEGIARQGDMMGVVEQVIAYNGYSATRGAKKQNYPGVTAGSAYLIDVGHRRYDFLSRWKHALRRQMGGGDIRRFILEDIIWDARFATFANPARAVQRIVWPSATDGAA